MPSPGDIAAALIAAEKTAAKHGEAGLLTKLLRFFRFAPKEGEPYVRDGMIIVPKRVPEDYDDL